MGILWVASSASSMDSIEGVLLPRSTTAVARPTAVSSATREKSGIAGIEGIKAGEELTYDYGTDCYPRRSSKN